MNGWATTIVCILAGAFVLGGVGVAYTQSAANAKIVALEERQKANQPAIDGVDVLADNVVTIKGDLKDLDKKMDEVLREIRKQ